MKTFKVDSAETEWALWDWLAQALEVDLAICTTKL